MRGEIERGEVRAERGRRKRGRVGGKEEWERQGGEGRREREKDSNFFLRRCAEKRKRLDGSQEGLSF